MFQDNAFSLQDLVRFLQEMYSLRLFQMIDYLQDDCQYHARNALPGKILQEMY